MDLATLIGLVAGIGVMLGAIILGGSAGMFVNPPSLIIVIGGTIAAVLMKFSMSQFIGAFKVAMKTFMHKEEKVEQLIEDLENMANTARKEGLLALEGVDVTNTFLQKGIQMMVDGHTPEMVRGVLKKDMDNAIGRHDIGQKIFKGIGDFAPAMGRANKFAIIAP
jgi:chemotaxis protein MotA